MACDCCCDKLENNSNSKNKNNDNICDNNNNNNNNDNNNNNMLFEGQEDDRHSMIDSLREKELEGILCPCDTSDIMYQKNDTTINDNKSIITTKTIDNKGEQEICNFNTKKIEKGQKMEEVEMNLPFKSWSTNGATSESNHEASSLRNNKIIQGAKSTEKKAVEDINSKYHWHIQNENKNKKG